MKRFWLLVCALLSSCSSADAREEASLEESPEGRVSIGFAGDLMCHNSQLAAAYQSRSKTYRFSPMFEPVASLLSKPDVMIANLETTLPGDPRKYRGFPLFGAPDSFVHAIKDAGVDVLATANNHCLDSFRSGLIRTVEVTRAAGFHQLGTYRSKADHASRRVLIVEKNGLRLALLNYTYGTNGIKIPDDVVVNTMDESVIREDLAYARRLDPDATIVIYHWGYEYYRKPSSRQKRFARISFENGADIVLGAHSHVVQPYSTYELTDRYGERKQRLVLYSAGNFISNQQKSHTKGGIIFYFDLVRNPNVFSSQRVLIENVRYEQTWVYRRYAGGKRRFSVVPIESASGIGGYERSLMRQHDASTRKLLAPSRKSVCQFEETYDGGNLLTVLPVPPVVPLANLSLPEVETRAKGTGHGLRIRSGAGIFDTTPGSISLVKHQPFSVEAMARELMGGNERQPNPTSSFAGLIQIQSRHRPTLNFGNTYFGENSKARRFCFPPVPGRAHSLVSFRFPSAGYTHGDEERERLTRLEQGRDLVSEIDVIKVIRGNYPRELQIASNQKKPGYYRETRSGREWYWYNKVTRALNSIRGL